METNLLIHAPIFSTISNNINGMHPARNLNVLFSLVQFCHLIGKREKLANLSTTLILIVNYLCRKENNSIRNCSFNYSFN